MHRSAIGCLCLVGMTVQVEDTVTLQPIQPASGLSACPGQDFTLNCTIVRVTNTPGVVPPSLTWQYRMKDFIVYLNPSDNSDKFYTAIVIVML